MKRTTPAQFRPISQLLALGRADDYLVCYDGARRLAWCDFSTRVNASVAALSERAASRWLIACSDAVDFCVALLAVLHAGRRAIIPPNLQAGTVEQLRSQYDDVLGPELTRAGDAPAPTYGRAPHPPLVPETAWIELFTSGSSGLPKRVEKSLAQLETEVRTLESCWGALLGDAAVVATVPHYHIYGMLFRLLWPLSAGRAFDTMLCAEPQSLLDRIRAVGQAAVVSSPAHLSRLPELMDIDALAPAVRFIFSSGAPLAASVARQFERSLGWAPTEIYGSTETGGIAWRRQGDASRGSAWTPLPGVEVGQADTAALRIRSPHLRNRGWMTLDDRVELLQDGRFELGGRLDRTLKVEGKRVALPDLEQRLRQHPWVHDVGIVALDGHQHTLGAVVVLRPTARADFERDGRRHASDTLRQFLSHWFEPVVVPKRWRFVDRLPVNDRGKLSAADLAQVFHPARTGEMPEVRAEQHSAGRIRLELYVPPDLIQLAGHFPSQPILPGVVQIDWALRLARARLPDLGAFAAMENVRFQSIVFPESVLTLELEVKDGGSRLAFTYTSRGKRCSSGTVALRPT